MSSIALYPSSFRPTADVELPARYGKMPKKGIKLPKCRRQLFERSVNQPVSYEKPSLEVRRRPIKHQWDDFEIRKLKWAITCNGLDWSIIQQNIFPEKTFQQIKNAYTYHLRKNDSSAPSSEEIRSILQHARKNKSGKYNCAEISAKVNTQFDRFFRVRSAEFVSNVIKDIEIEKENYCGCLFKEFNGAEKMLPLTPLQWSKRNHLPTVKSENKIKKRKPIDTSKEFPDIVKGDKRTIYLLKPAELASPLREEELELYPQ